MTALSAWIGRTQTAEDTLTLRPAQLMEATLDHRPVQERSAFNSKHLISKSTRAQKARQGLGDTGLGPNALRPGDPLPPLWHWLYFPPQVATSALGPDGHPARGDFVPPVPLPRRMWAGGRFSFIHPLRLGAAVTRHSTIQDVAAKTGASGALCFVTVRNVFETDGVEALWEEHDIVYRSAVGATPPTAPTPPDAAQISQTITPSMPLLFRYSALTFNSHRIHYDQDYCRHVEGYPGCIVHGPLVATLLAGPSAQQLGPLASFSFRATAPLFHTQSFGIHAKATETGLTAWAETPDGGQAMLAKAS